MDDTSTSAASPAPAAPRRRAATIAAWAGIVVQALTVWIYLMVGLVAPPWMIVAGLVWWALLLVLAIRWRRARPWLAASTPLVGLGVLSLALWAGDVFLGWTA